jgi:hypothetical protein
MVCAWLEVVLYRENTFYIERTRSSMVLVCLLWSVYMVYTVTNTHITLSA